jgi:hypothetical protein
VTSQGVNFFFKFGKIAEVFCLVHSFQVEGKEDGDNVQWNQFLSGLDSSPFDEDVYFDVSLSLESPEMTKNVILFIDETFEADLEKLKSHSLIFSPKLGSRRLTLSNVHSPSLRRRNSGVISSLVLKMKNPMNGVKMKSKKRFMKKVNCFLGEDCLSWVMSNVEKASERESALEIINQLLSEGLITPIAANESETFDVNSFYQFYGETQ